MKESCSIEIIFVDFCIVLMNFILRAAGNDNECSLYML